MIGLKRALEMMRIKDAKGDFVPFEVTYVTYDRAKKTGGELITLKNVTLPHRHRLAIEQSNQPSKSHKRPAHFRSGTINFRLPNGGFRKAHIHLITHFNSEQVV